MLLRNEGGYNNYDSAGETMHGITKAVALENGYYGPMEDMPISIAKSIYRKRYWATWMECASMPLSFELFDAAVNCGPTRAAKLLQKALGVKVDGIVGPKTMAAASADSTAELWVKFAATVMEFRVGLDGWNDYSRGWTNRAVSNLRRGAEML